MVATQSCKVEMHAKYGIKPEQCNTMKSLSNADTEIQQVPNVAENRFIQKCFGKVLQKAIYGLLFL